jgi:PP-loop superfamily ATP-utilizing enzyme
MKKMCNSVPPKQFVAFSGGKDSTALVLRLAELGEPFECVFTPTGNELPDLTAHMDHVLALAGNPKLHLPKAPTLAELMTGFNALPNHRQRWCTRMIKIVPCIAFLKQNPGSTLVVGLRADETARLGLYGDYATYRYPLREWGWNVKEVLNYCRARGVDIPQRTDCAWCYGQQLVEWYRLWQQHPEIYRQGEEWEERTGHTFRSPSRDTWPAPMKGLRQQFESGRIPKERKKETDACRVCSL